MMRGKGGKRGVDGHNISAAPIQIAVQRCPSARCDAVQLLISTQYRGRPGVVPDATVCVCVSR